MGTREARVKGTKDMKDTTEKLLTITGQQTVDNLIKTELCQCRKDAEICPKIQAGCDLS